jgi:hypothetical protein
MSKRQLWRISISLTLALFLLGLCYGARLRVPDGQPEQIRSQVQYDPNLSDPFFETEELSYRCTEHAKELRYKLTARCLGSHQYEHSINFCFAKLLEGNTIELFIHDNYDCPGPDDNLKIVVQNGVFWSQYWTVYKHLASNYGLIWTTRMQKLTLDKKEYGKGDVIKGKIDFECVQENGDPKLIEEYGRNPRTITVKGVFKTILE